MTRKMSPIQAKQYFLFFAFFTLIACGQSGSVVQSPIDEGGANIPEPIQPQPGFNRVVDTINVADEAPKIDILIVMDNSRSMSYEQLNMSSRLGTFLDELQNINWNLGITTTDVSGGFNSLSDGKLILFNRMNKYTLSSEDNKNEAHKAFSETINFDGTGDGSEQGIKATYRALERNLEKKSENKKLIRDNAALAVVLVSDDDETLPPKQNPTFRNSPKELLNMINKKWPSKNVTFHSIIVKPGDEACLNNTDHRNENERYGHIYAEISQMTNGIIGSVCETDYSRQLAEIGNSTSNLIKRYTLKCVPQDVNSDGKTDLNLFNSNSGQKITSFKINGTELLLDKPLALGEYKLEYFCK